MKAEETHEKKNTKKRERDEEQEEKEKRVQTEIRSQMTARKNQKCHKQEDTRKVNVNVIESDSAETSGTLKIEAVG